MKHKREHRVPLSARAQEILAEAKENAVPSEWVFPSAAGRPLRDLDLSGLLRELGVPAVPHGFRFELSRLGGRMYGRAPCRHGGGVVAPCPE